MALPNLSALPTAGFLRPDDAPTDPRPWWERHPLEPERKEEPEEEPKREEPKREEPRREETQTGGAQTGGAQTGGEERGGRRGAVPRAVLRARRVPPPCNATAIELGISLYRMLFPHYRSLDCDQAADMEFPDENGQRINLALKNRFHPDLRLFHLIESGQDPFVEASLDKPFVPVFLEDTGRADSFGRALGPYGSSMAFRLAMEDVAKKNVTVRLVLDEDTEPAFDEDGAWRGATVTRFEVDASRLAAPPESPQAHVNNTVVKAVEYWYHVYAERSADGRPRVRRPPDEPPDEPRGWQFVPVVDPRRVGDVRSCERVALLPALELRAEARVEGTWAELKAREAAEGATNG